jgi:hypothetical protein
MAKKFEFKGDDISDGYHTFDELYEHRNLLFINMCLMVPEQCSWRSDYEGWFVLYCKLPHSYQISYHIQEKYLPLIRNKIVKCEVNPWDGHTSEDVLQRLQAQAREENLR